jgi:hypothetical protein
MAIALAYCPHRGQAEIHNAREYQFRAVCCGRRFGKTLCAAGELLDCGAIEPGDYGWIAPTYFIADRGVEALQSIAGGFVTVSGRNPVTATFEGLNGAARILFLSADNPDSILGLGFKGIVVDEAARIEARTWQQIVRPTIAQTHGWALLITTPLGRNWFFDLHTRGRDEAEKQYKSFTFPSTANPFFPEAELEEARRTTPEDIFRQEYLAEFLEDSAGVFHRIEDCLLDVVTRSGPVVVGVDVAKHTDFTVCIAMDRVTGHCFDMDRFNHLDWPIQKERILNFARKHQGRVILDATGAGDPIFDDLRRAYPNIEPFKFTGPSKTELIQRLIVAVEQRQVGWPGTWNVLTDEMKRYEYAIAANGGLSYNAPSGFHDDCVIALALANRLRSAAPPGAMRVLPCAGSRELRLRPTSGRMLAGGGSLRG